jgi:hypothetical protein
MGMNAVMDGKKDLQNIGQRLKKLRTERGVTLQEVSAQPASPFPF